MALPSGSGTEVLKRHAFVNTAAWTNILTVPTDHIYTILSIIFNDQAGTAGKIQLRLNTTADVYLISGNSTTQGTQVPAYSTFVFSDKFVLTSGDVLDVHNATAQGHWYISYIDQDWT